MGYENLERIIGLEEGSPIAARQSYRKAKLLRELGNKESALECYRDAVDEDPFMIPAWLGIFDVRKAQGYGTRDAELAEAASKILVYGLLEQRAHVAEVLGDDGTTEILAAIERDFQSRIATDPQDYITRYEYAIFLHVTYEDDKRFDEDLEKLMQEFPDEEAAFITAYTGANGERRRALRDEIGRRFGAEAIAELDDIDNSGEEVAAALNAVEVNNTLDETPDDQAPPTEEGTITDEEVTELVKLLGDDYGIRVTPEEMRRWMEERRRTRWGRLWAGRRDGVRGIRRYDRVNSRSTRHPCGQRRYFNR